MICIHFILIWDAIGSLFYKLWDQLQKVLLFAQLVIFCFDNPSSDSTN